MSLSDQEKLARIRLLRSPNVGPVGYRQLLARFGDAIAAVEALPDLAAGAGRRSYSLCPVGRAEAELQAVARARAVHLFHDEPAMSGALQASEGAPPILIAQGAIALMQQPAVAIVGARNAAVASIKLARDFAAALAAEGITVVSGLARGIDGAAHQGALAGSASPATIGVIASGIDIAYPPEHAALQAEVSERGLLLTEHPPGTDPLSRHFPARNRIIAGLAQAVLVVEASPKSGSLITARLAGEMGREVLAIPGSPIDARARGCNGLIREGATLVQSPDDVIEALAPWRENGELPLIMPSPATTPLPNLRAAAPVPPRSIAPSGIAGMMSAAPVQIDELVRQSGASTADVQMALIELELAGQLQRHAGGRVSLIAS